MVIATYNRADILPYAVRSVLLNKGIDLEVVVVGDGCSDGTERAVLDLGDSRIRYFNMPRNWGEQSVPSNKGIALARGEFVAFLNHDDLFMPWHLSDLLAAHREGADVTWCPYIVARSVRSRHGPVPRSYEMAGVTATKAFDPAVFIVASATCYRKAVLEKIGGWTRTSDTVVSPSQDLLFKAHKAGYRISRTDLPSVLALYSGDRSSSYARPAADEHQWYFELLQGGGERLFAELLRAGVHDCARKQRERAETSAAFFAAWRLYRHVSLLAQRFGFHPNALKVWLQYRRRGGYVNSVRQSAGLSKIDFRGRRTVNRESAEK